MDRLREFEKEVLRLLLEQRIPAAEIESAIAAASISNYKWSPAGYFLTLKFPFFNGTKREVFDEPSLTGTAEEVSGGFVLFAEDGELLFECHSWGESNIPENFRDLDVRITHLSSSPS